MIEVRHISKEFVSAKKYPGLKGALKGLVSREKTHKLAVDDISFHIGKGEIVGYIGSNGAGKSTTIKMMTGILTPTEGTCLVGGVDPCKNRRKNAANIGVVFGQRTQLWWDLPLSESFTILKEIYDVSDADYEERMELPAATVTIEVSGGVVQNVYASPDLPEISVELIDFDNLREESEAVETHSRKLLSMIAQNHKHIF